MHVCMQQGGVIITGGTPLFKKYGRHNIMMQLSRPNW